MEKLFTSRQSWHHHFDVVIFRSTFTLFVPCFTPGKGINRRSGSTKRDNIFIITQVLLLILSTDDNAAYS